MRGPLTEGVIMKIILSLLLSAFLCVDALAQTPQVDRADITDYGIYTARLHSTAPSPGEPTGVHSQASNIRHVETTQSIPARMGVRFGFRYRLVGTPKGVNVPLRTVVVFPPPGLRKNPSEPYSAQSEYVTTRPIGKVSYADYGFEHDWEVVPGPWTMQIWYEGRKLAERQFTVAKK